MNNILETIGQKNKESLITGIITHITHVMVFITWNHGSSRMYTDIKNIHDNIARLTETHSEYYKKEYVVKSVDVIGADIKPMKIRFDKMN